MDTKRASQVMFQDPETIKSIAKFQAARAKMTEEDKADETDDVGKQLGRLPSKRNKLESPYEVDTTEEADMNDQADAPAPGDTIEIGNDNDTNKWAHGQDEDNENILLPQPARLQGCENDPEEESLFSNESDNDNDDNDPDDD